MVFFDSFKKLVGQNLAGSNLIYIYEERKQKGKLYQKAGGRIQKEEGY